MVGRLMAAAEAGDLEQILECLAAGVPIEATDSRRNTALHVAAGNGRWEVLEYLVCAGANVNARNRYGATPLHSAAYSDTSGTCTAALLNAGARINVVDADGWTPLHAAAAFTNSTSMQLLQSAGADPEARNSYGFKPLDLAFFRRLLED
ncbi:hypothetical protein R5R35_013032 [Gryllus longicercus]|uniref:Ankyrin repeat domain-containing protein n=1 Tax=Gryllus longicercus TaxID=2509291 RepID=A0AAN9YXZ9_9ORTH